ncbi:MAG: hypothetical protein L3K09_00405 [Thermoplasmata archaeon]|nr:hypothetical protein [Thermoplasmata archaeon]
MPLTGSGADTTGAIELSVHFGVPTNGFHHVGANLFLGWRATGGAFDGSRLGNCHALLVPGNLTTVEYFNGNSWAGSPPPGGPVFNKSTYYYYAQYSYEYGTCLVWSSVGLVLNSYVEDLTNYSTRDPSSTFGFRTSVVAEVTETYNTTNWACGNATLWNHGKWRNSSYACTSGNVSTTSYWADYVTGVKGTSTSFSDSGTLTGTAWCNGTFINSHHYIWIIYLQGATSVTLNGWSHGSAGAALNLATRGNGFSLNWVRVS